METLKSKNFNLDLKSAIAQKENLEFAVNLYEKESVNRKLDVQSRKIALGYKNVYSRYLEETEQHIQELTRLTDES